MKMSELDEQLSEYIAEWRKQRQKEEDELNKLKDKQAKRKVRLYYNGKKKIIIVLFNNNRLLHFFFHL